MVHLVEVARPPIMVDRVLPRGPVALPVPAALVVPAVLAAPLPDPVPRAVVVVEWLAAVAARPANPVIPRLGLDPQAAIAAPRRRVMYQPIQAAMATTRPHKAM